uniref:Uncharacterized protein n=1 Tax=Romanomermis culicivorax TaxID=13658 RepID=A0A915HJ78_ROMCU
MDGDAENAKIDSQVSNCSAIFSQETHRYLLKDLYDFASTLLSQGDTNCVATQYQIHESEVEGDMQYTATIPRSQGFLRHEELNIQTDSYTIRPECGFENYAQQQFIPPTQDTSNFSGRENIPFYNYQNTLLTHVEPNQSLYSSQFSQNSNENYILKDFNLNDPVNNLCNLDSLTRIESGIFSRHQLSKQEQLVEPFIIGVFRLEYRFESVEKISVPVPEFQPVNKGSG